MIYINTRDPIDWQQLVLDSQPSLVCRTPRSDAGDEDAFVISFEWSRAKSASDAQTKALVGPAEADLVDDLLGVDNGTRVAPEINQINKLGSSN